MAGIVGFILKKRMVALWEWPYIGKFILTLFMALITGLIYGLGAGFGVDYLVAQGTISISEFMLFYTSLLGILCFLIDIFPVLKPPSIIFKAYQPVSFGDQTKLFLYDSFARNFWFFIVLLFVLTLSVSKELTIQNTLPYFFVVIIVYMLNRVTRFLILFHVKHSVLITIMTVSLIIGSYISLWKVTDFFWLIFLLIVLLVSSLGLSFRINYFKKEKLQAINRYYRKGIWFSKHLSCF